MTEKEKELFQRALSVEFMFLAGASVAVFLAARVTFAAFDERAAILVAVLAYTLCAVAAVFIVGSERTARWVIGLMLAIVSGVGIAPLLAVLPEEPMPEIFVALSLPLAAIYAVGASLLTFWERVRKVLRR